MQRTFGRCQKARGQQRIARRLPFGQQVEVDQRLQLCRPVGIKRRAAIDRRQAPARIAGKDRRRLDQQPKPVDPGRAGQQRVLSALKDTNRGFRRGGSSGRSQRLGQGEPVETRFSLGPDDPCHDRLGFTEQPIGDQTVGQTLPGQ